MAVPPLAFALIACGMLSHCARRWRRGVDEPGVPAWGHATLWTVTAIVLALPARVLLWGKTIIVPNQLWLLDMFPVIGVIRVPSRLGVVGLVGLSVLAGLSFREIQRWALHRWQARPWSRVVGGALAAVFALAIFDQPRSGWGYPPGFVVVKRPPIYPTYQLWGEIPYAAALQAGRGPLLEIGGGVFAEEPEDRAAGESIAMIRSIPHWRPLLNGYSSYWPKQYERVMSLAQRLPEDPDALATLRKETGVELILVWPDRLPPSKRVAWERLAADVPAGESEQGAMLFRLTDEQ
jgi:hypothetical protein